MFSNLFLTYKIISFLLYIKNKLLNIPPDLFLLAQQTTCHAGRPFLQKKRVDKTKQKSYSKKTDGHTRQAGKFSRNAPFLLYIKNKLLNIPPDLFLLAQQTTCHAGRPFLGGKRVDKTKQKSYK